ncbi:U3 small nucleolar RNA-associated protein 25-like [Nilaparvata lugens]|uniref:U3 small nucleolar RNA-associated protein 25-like n=1 Tax=Nilaparvata lugens TaxID=108931 RepID=UPI00193CE078|nr:U3 small nucleolar RNA-associated protein 25-like [Nilaparvata lugens]
MAERKKSKLFERHLTDEELLELLDNSDIELDDTDADPTFTLSDEEEPDVDEAEDQEEEDIQFTEAAINNPINSEDEQGNELNQNSDDPLFSNLDNPITNEN